MTRLWRYDKERGRYVWMICHSDGTSCEMYEPWELLKPGQVYYGDLEKIFKELLKGYCDSSQYFTWDKWDKRGDTWECEYCGSEHPNLVQGKCPNCGGSGMMPVDGVRCVWCGSLCAKPGEFCPDCGGPSTRNSWM